MGELDRNIANVNNGSSYTGPWIKVEGFSEVSVEWISAGGATITPSVDESFDGVTQDRTTAAGAAGANGPAVPTVVPVSAPYVRMRLAVTVANTTTFRASLMAVG
jgi:hypothetical protein